jgi:hypothetical protein
MYIALSHYNDINCVSAFQIVPNVRQGTSGEQRWELPVLMHINSYNGRNRRGRLSGLAGTKARLLLNDWYHSAPRVWYRTCEPWLSARTGLA